MAANSFIQQLSPYQPGKPVDELKRELGLDKVIKLASNENPLGASPKAISAIKNSLTELSRYPEGSCHYLRQKLAKKLAINENQLTFGNGSNDVLDLLARTFLNPQSNVVFSQYAFAGYYIASQSVGAQIKMVPALPEDHLDMPLGHDLDAMLAAIDNKTAVVFLANPNNPTGTWLNQSALYHFIQSIPEEVIIVLDEAYIEYVPDNKKAGFVNGLDWINRFPNLVVTRTFSKIYGLASLRVGYSVSSAAVADLLNRVRQPFNVNYLAQIAAEAALDDEDFIRKSQKLNQQGLQFLQQSLDQLGISYLPSMGNFICAHFGKDAAKINQQLLQAGFIVRPVDNYQLDAYLRITIGTEEENQQFINQLSRILAK